MTTSSASSTVATVLIKGYDVYGQPMSQNLTLTAGSTAYTTKAFKYFVSATPITTDATYNYSVGISDVYGYNVRCDKWEYSNVFWAAVFETSGDTTKYFTPAVKTTPATTTTGDVRGTYQVGANGPLSGGSYTSSNGTTNRLFIAMSAPLSNLVLGTPQNPAPFFGVTQV